VQRIFSAEFRILTFSKGFGFLHAMSDEPALNLASKQRRAAAAQRALAEAQARRAGNDRKSKEQPKELDGRNGPDPVRYGDWEVKGIASDF